MNHFARFALIFAISTTAYFGASQQHAIAAIPIDVTVSVAVAPPALPSYAQPPAPYSNAIWQPGYWAWGPYGYYWVPGTWVAAPQSGYLWTPGYWGVSSGSYRWNPGFWATQVGFYGGISYGNGYFGNGFVGGGWHNGTFRYNTAVMNVDRTFIHDTYVNRTVLVRNGGTRFVRVSYNGGPHGVRAFATHNDRLIARGRRFEMTHEQRAHVRYAEENRNNLASVNRGRPREAAAVRPFSTENPARHFERIGDRDRQSAASVPQRTRATPREQQHVQTQHTAPQHTAPQHTAPQHTAPQHTAPQHTAPQHTAPQQPVHRATPQRIQPIGNRSNAAAPAKPRPHGTGRPSSRPGREALQVSATLSPLPFHEQDEGNEYR